jgi:pimeloyl-ACP methyl ester carboxylesterase
MRNVTAALAVLGMAACGTSGPGVGSGAPGFDVTKTWPIASQDVELTAGGHKLGATIVAPTDPGPWPAVLLFAGSGPTDRDWNSQLMPGDNGSGKLLAEQLASKGIVVIRWDKSGTKKNHGPPPEELTLDSYRDEALAAYDAVHDRPDVRDYAIFLAGHSEGGIHATRLAQKLGDNVRGVIFLSAPGRSMATVMLEQLAGNYKSAHVDDAKAKAELAKIKQAFDDFLAGKPVDTEHVSDFSRVNQLLKVITAPETEKLSRPLFGFDPAVEAAKLPQRHFFVGGGGKDIQVDPKTDGGALRDALTGAGKTDVTYLVAPDMDHVLKYQDKSMADLRKDLMKTQESYNAADRTLDVGFADALAAWIAQRSNPTSGAE